MTSTPEELASMAWHHYRRGADAIREAIAAARAEEREVCAKIADGLAELPGAAVTAQAARITAKEIAAGIRARAN